MPYLHFTVGTIQVSSPAGIRGNRIWLTQDFPVCPNRFRELVILVAAELEEIEVQRIKVACRHVGITDNPHPGHSDCHGFAE